MRKRLGCLRQFYKPLDLKDKKRRPKTHLSPDQIFFFICSFAFPFQFFFLLLFPFPVVFDPSLLAVSHLLLPPPLNIDDSTPQFVFIPAQAGTMNYC